MCRLKFIDADTISNLIPKWYRKEQARKTTEDSFADKGMNKIVLFERILDKPGVYVIPSWTEQLSCSADKAAMN